MIESRVAEPVRTWREAGGSQYFQARCEMRILLLCALQDGGFKR